MSLLIVATPYRGIGETLIPRPRIGETPIPRYLAKEPYKRDDILPKRPMILRSLLIVAPYMEESERL